MIYFDNAATSWPKPSETKEEVFKALERFGANPGRGSYGFAKKTKAYLEDARKEIAEFLGIYPYENLIFTSGNTMSSNIVVNHYKKRKGNVLYTAAEHNSIIRSVKSAESAESGSTNIDLCKNTNKGLKAFESESEENVKLIAVNHASNVFGAIQPIEKVIKLANYKKIPILGDLAQTAGIITFSPTKEGLDFASYAGHKSLLGYGGIGCLYVRNPEQLNPLIYGGTGTFSHIAEQFSVSPSGFEAGTVNMIGIASMLGGIRYIKKKGINKIREHELNLTEYFIKGLKRIPKAVVYEFRALPRVPVVSLNIENRMPGEVAMILEKKANICVRAGLHCAPDAHRTIGTLAKGTVRFSFGPFNTISEIDTALSVLADI